MISSSPTADASPPWRDPVKPPKQPSKLLPSGQEPKAVVLLTVRTCVRTHLWIITEWRSKCNRSHADLAHAGLPVERYFLLDVQHLQKVTTISRTGNLRIFEQQIRTSCVQIIGPWLWNEANRRPPAVPKLMPRRRDRK